MMMLRAIATLGGGESHDEQDEDLADGRIGRLEAFKAMKFSAAEEKISSPAMSMPMSVRRRIRPKMPAGEQKKARGPGRPPNVLVQLGARCSCAMNRGARRRPRLDRP